MDENKSKKLQSKINKYVKYSPLKLNLDLGTWNEFI